MSDEFPPAGEPTPPVGDATPPAAPTPPPPPPAGAVPPPPPAPAVGGHAASPAEAPWSVGNAFSYGWAKFQQYVGPILIAMLVLFIGGAIIGGIWFAIVGAIQNALFPTALTINPETGALSTSGPGFFGTLIFGALGALVYYTIAGFIQAAITRAALAVTEGRAIDTATILSTERLGPIIVTALLVSIATSIGYLFCGIGAVIVGFFLAFSFYFLIDKDLAPVDALKASFAFVRENVGDLIVFYLASLLAYFVGAILCGIGLIVAFPVVVIATAFTYKKLTNQDIAA